MYYDKLMLVREKNDLSGWIIFFLSGVSDTAQLASKNLSDIVRMKKEMEKIIPNTFNRRADNASILLNYMFKKPLLTSSEVEDVCNVTKKTALSLLKEFVTLGWLKETALKKRQKYFVFESYIKIFKD